MKIGMILRFWLIWENLVSEKPGTICVVIGVFRHQG